MPALLEPIAAERDSGETGLTLSILESLVREGKPLPEGQLDEFARRIETHIDRVVADAEGWLPFWQTLSELARNNGAEIIADHRAAIKLSLNSKLENLIGARELAGRLESLTGIAVADEAAIGDAEAKLGQFRKDVLSRWQTLEDLEAILIERLAIPHGRLHAWARKNPSSQEWYDAPDDAFPPWE